jgi:hypothetical protein
MFDAMTAKMIELWIRNHIAALPREANHIGNDGHGEQRGHKPKPLVPLVLGLQLVHFPFAFSLNLRDLANTIFNR